MRAPNRKIARLVSDARETASFRFCRTRANARRLASQKARIRRAERRAARIETV